MCPSPQIALLTLTSWLENLCSVAPGAWMAKYQAYP